MCNRDFPSTATMWHARAFLEKVKASPWPSETRTQQAKLQYSLQQNLARRIARPERWAKSPSTLDAQSVAACWVGVVGSFSYPCFPYFFESIPEFCFRAICILNITITHELQQYTLSLKIPCASNPAQFPDCDDERFKLFKVYKKNKISSVLAIGHEPRKKFSRTHHVFQFLTYLFDPGFFWNSRVRKMAWSPIRTSVISKPSSKGNTPHGRNILYKAHTHTHTRTHVST